MRKLIDKLRVYEPESEDEWERIKEGLDCSETLWYPSSGTDFAMLARLKDKHLPVGIFLMNDYAVADRIMSEIDGVVFHRRIPLRLWSATEAKRADAKYRHRVHPFVTKHAVDARAPQFIYVDLSVGGGRFRGLVSPMENSVLLVEVVSKLGIRFDTVCGKQDGCRKGGATYCVNDLSGPFMPTFFEDRRLLPRYWVSDHLGGRSRLMTLFDSRGIGDGDGGCGKLAVYGDLRLRGRYDGDPDLLLRDVCQYDDEPLALGLIAESVGLHRRAPDRRPTEVVLAEYALKRGADVDSEGGSSVGARSNGTPLTFVGSPALARFLIENGADAAKTVRAGSGAAVSPVSSAQKAWHEAHDRGDGDAARRYAELLRILRRGEHLGANQ